MTLCAVAVVALLATTVFAYATRDALVEAGVAINPTAFSVLVVAVLIGVYVYFVKVARLELKRLNEHRLQQPPEE